MSTSLLRRHSDESKIKDWVGRYLVSIQSGPFIRELSAHKKIAHTCLTYLMFTCFDLSITQEEMDAAVLGSHYILQAYATTHWLDHVKESIRDDTSSTDFMILCQKIWRFLAKRTNQNFDQKAARKEGVLELKQFEKDQEHLYRELCYINSSLALELSESLKPSKKNSEPPNFRLSSPCVIRKGGSCCVLVQIPKISKTSDRISTFRYESTRSRGFHTLTPGLFGIIPWTLHALHRDLQIFEMS